MIAFLFAACALAAAWWAFCGAVDLVADRRDAAARSVTDPGQAAIAAATAPRPFPTGRHRRPDTTGGTR